MKKVLFGLFALSTLAFAGETNLYLRTGADLNGKYDVFKYEDEGFNKKSADNFSWEIAVEATKNINSNLELGLGVAYQKHGNPEAEYLIDDGREDGKPGVDMFELPGYTSIPLYLVAKYKFNTIDNIVPYIKANLGYSLNDEDAKLKNTWYPKDEDIEYGTDVELNVKNGLYYGIGAGFEYNNFTMDLMYQVNKAKAEVTEPYAKDLVVEKIKKDYDYSRVTLSFGYKFNI